MRVTPQSGLIPVKHIVSGASQLPKGGWVALPSLCQSGQPFNELTVGGSERQSAEVTVVGVPAVTHERSNRKCL